MTQFFIFYDCDAWLNIKNQYTEKRKYVPFNQNVYMVKHNIMPHSVVIFTIWKYVSLLCGGITLIQQIKSGKGKRIILHTAE